ncbi:hypothetical protein [Altericista sp. CCNU0014]
MSPYKSKTFHRQAIGICLADECRGRKQEWQIARSPSHLNAGS